jgi:CRISPR system Cascade subunit CasC
MESKRMSAKFLQLHTLHSYPAALPNRDDAGLAKRLPFGGTTRGRISSQSLKRRWRTADGPWSLQGAGLPMGIRSKFVVERRILAGCDLSDRKTMAVAEALWRNLYGGRAADPRSRQALFFGEPEIAHLRERALAALDKATAKDAVAAMETFFREEADNLRALAHGAGLESALFGRMVTSDPTANRDAAIHVAHAFTVHALERELDFMSVVDDLVDPKESGERGAAGLFDSELTSGLYYGYVVVDVPLLIGNLGGDRDVAAEVLRRLTHLIATASPGAKRGSTAPYAHAEFMLIEAGEGQPRTLANAFREAVDLRSGRLLERSVERILSHLARLDAAYGMREERMAMNLSDADLPGVRTADLAQLADWLASRVGPDARP